MNQLRHARAGPHQHLLRGKEQGNDFKVGPIKQVTSTGPHARSNHPPASSLHPPPCASNSGRFAPWPEGPGRYDSAVAKLEARCSLFETDDLQIHLLEESRNAQKRNPRRNEEGRCASDDLKSCETCHDRSPAPGSTVTLALTLKNPRAPASELSRHFPCEAVGSEWRMLR